MINNPIFIQYLSDMTEEILVIVGLFIPLITKIVLSAAHLKRVDDTNMFDKLHNVGIDKIKEAIREKVLELIKIFVNTTNPIMPENHRL